MISFNYQAPIYTFMTLVDNINYLYEEVSVEKAKPYTSDSNENVDVTEVSTHNKKRILTYYRNELLVMYSDNIAHIFTENDITYIVNMQGKKSIANESLGHLFEELNSQYFFKVNKKNIIRISAIKKVSKTDNGLEVETFSPSDHTVLIKESKVSAFKKWFEK